MTQPEYVPLESSDQVRPSMRLPIPGSWVANRPADLPSGSSTVGKAMGATGPDLGYGLKLVRETSDQIVLAEGESLEDAMAGCFACGCKRAASFGRAPVVYDMLWAYTLWGYRSGAPKELIAYRSKLFAGAGHHYHQQREIADTVPEGTVRMTEKQVAADLAGWRSLIRVGKSSGSTVSSPMPEPVRIS